MGQHHPVTCGFSLTQPLEPAQMLSKKTVKAMAEQWPSGQHWSNLSSPRGPSEWLWLGMLWKGLCLPSIPWLSSHLGFLPDTSWLTWVWSSVLISYCAWEVPEAWSWNLVSSVFLAPAFCLLGDPGFLSAHSPHCSSPSHWDLSLLPTAGLPPSG